MEEFASQLQRIKQDDANRDDFIQSLISRIDVLKIEKGELSRRLKHAEDLRDKYSDDLGTEKSRSTVLETNIASLNDKMNSCPFVMVLLDGDCTFFQDKYTTRGTEGGHDAARDFHGHLLAYFKAHSAFKDHWEIMVKMYCNTAGMAKTIAKAGVVRDVEVWRDFVTGFNQMMPFFEIIDSGNDKEAADTRVKAHIEFHLNIVQCQHVMLGASADNSYTGFLRRFTKAGDRCDRLILLESAPFPSAFNTLSEKFKVTRFDDVFKKEKIAVNALGGHKDGKSPSKPHSRMTFAQATNITTLELSQSKSLIRFISSDGLVQPKPSHEDHADRCVVANLSLPGVPTKINFNKNGFRIDPYIAFRRDGLQKLKEKNLCTNHFLTKCQNRDDTCHYSHDRNIILSDYELESLKVIARMIPCGTVKCVDPYCIAGHRCMFDTRCRNRKACHFPLVMHDVSTTVDHSKTIKVKALA